jgi:outer membrane protein assembly factor BamD (BamD/ComL family)
MRFVFLAAAVLLPSYSVIFADTWRLEEGGQWEAVNAEGRDKFLLEAAKIKELVDAGRSKAAKKAFARLKAEFPEIAGPDYDLFVKAEIFYSKGKPGKAVRTYQKILNEYPKSSFRPAAIDRQFSIAKGFLAGQKYRFLGIFKLSRYSEGIRIMEKITDWTGIDSPIGVDAAIAVAENYQKRKKYNDAYLKWWEISLQYQSGRIGRESLLGMAQSKQAVYNQHPEPQRPLYDASCLRTAKSCYEKFKLLYPRDANELDVDETLVEINGQLAEKQLTIGEYYIKVGYNKAANLYYGMVISDWPGTEAAQQAERIINEDRSSEENSKATSE